mmetsp:Transcript_24828/g.62569  ORF Transcript_24828/g.62569 Transcript_24828/m.62569 type:complete len:234 (+) Transcript_24828:598-1299(+)
MLGASSSSTAPLPIMRAAADRVSLAMAASFTSASYGTALQLREAVQRCAAATPLITSSVRSIRWRNASLVEARIVPLSSTSSGMTLKAPSPVLNRLTDTTPASVGDSSRATSCCRLTTACAPAVMGSRKRCGCAACPPAPRMRAVKRVEAAMIIPGRVSTVPELAVGQTWMPNIADTPASAFSLSSRAAPPPPSSAGWKISFTQPASPGSRALSSLAAPSSIAVWPSCPQACM